jgi:hypothetical protein
MKYPLENQSLYMYRLVCIVLIHLFSLSSFAQILANDSLSREINVKALSFIQQYNSVLKFKSKADGKKFEELFLHQNVKIFNDVMPDNSLQTKVLPSEYIQKIMEYYSDSGFLEVTVRAYELGPITVEDDYASLSVLASKFVSSITKANVAYEDTFKIRLDIVYDFKKQKCFYSDISSTEKRGKYVQLNPHYRGFFLRDTIVNDTILINGLEYYVNNEGYALIKNMYEERDLFIQPIKNLVLFKSYSLPVHIPILKNKLDKKDKNIVKLNFWRWKVFAEFKYQTVFNGESPVKLASDTFGIVTKNGGSFSNYISMNLVRRVNEKGYWAIKIGAGADVYSFTNYLFKNRSTYEAIDPDGDSYIRINDLNEIVERNKLVYLTAPISIEKGFTYGRNSFFVNASYFLMLNLRATFDMDANAQYSGYYEDIGITFTENGVYDFGAYNFQLRNLPTMVDSRVMAYGLGFGYNRELNRRAYLELGVNYRKSIGYVFLENKLNLSDNYQQIRNISNLNHTFGIEYINLSVALNIKL